MNWKIPFAIAVGAPLILVASYFQLWTEPNYPSIKPWPSGTPNVGPYRPLVDEWRWKWLNSWYANSEDGVSGKQAWVWVPNDQGVPTLIPYYTTFPSWVPEWCIAFAWSAWRNNANNLKRPLRKDSLNKAWP